MASTNGENNLDDTASSLGDSSYDFLDDRSAVTTDDEGSADLALSFSSSDGHERETPTVTQPEQICRASGSLVTFQQSDQEENEHSTDNTTSQISQEEDPYIRFEEAPGATNYPLRFFEVSHTLKAYSSHEISGVLQYGPSEWIPDNLRLVVRQTMSGQKLVPDGPFRVIYVGDPVAKEAIMQKLGSTLAAFSTKSSHSLEKASSRYSVVPISSFGQRRSPEVLLVDSVGLEISVQDCITASFSRVEGGNDSISLTLSDNKLVTSAWSSLESRFAVSTRQGGWQLPHVAVFYLSDSDSICTKQTRRFTRAFMSRHRIKCLTIAQTQILTGRAEAVTLDYSTPHLCLETVNADQSKSSVVSRLPVDTSTFLQIDATQLNRNLAGLVEVEKASVNLQDYFDQESPPAQNLAANVSPKDGRNEAPKRSIGNDFQRVVHWRSSENQPLVFGTILLLLFLPGLIISIFQGYFSALHKQDVQKDIADQAHFSESSLRTAEPTRLQATAPTLFASSPILTQTESLRKPSPVTQSTDLAAFLLDSHALTPNNSAKFKVHVVGDCHVVLRPPHWFMRYRKAPKLVFEVMRRHTTVEHELSMLFDGVYALKVPREEAYGRVNVTVRTTSKPKLYETFEVDFGNSWLKAAGWKKAAQAMTESVRGDLDLVHTGLSTLYTSTSSELQIFVQDAVQRADALREEVDRLRRFSMNHTIKVTDLLLAQTRDLSQIVSAKLQNSSSALSRQVIKYNEHIRKDVALYVESKRAAVKAETRKLYKQSKIRKLARSTDRLRDRHFRRAQKQALKAWWTVAGRPKQSQAGVAHGCKARKRGVCSKKSLR